MSETNKRLALRWLEAIWNGDLDAPGAGGVVEQIVHPDFYNHEAAADRPGGPEGFRDTARRPASRPVCRHAGHRTRVLGRAHARTTPGWSHLAPTAEQSR